MPVSCLFRVSAAAAKHQIYIHATLCTAYNILFNHSNKNVEFHHIYRFFFNIFIISQYKIFFIAAASDDSNSVMQKCIFYQK